jgi:hypothetical protein
MTYDSSAWAAGPFGLDPRATEAPIQRVATPSAQHYDGALRDWQLDANGIPLPADPVDVGMVLSFIDPNNNTFGAIRYLGAPDMQKQLEDAAANAQPAKRLIAEGKAKIVSVTYDDTLTRSLKVLICYKNLVTGQSNTV